MPEPNSGPPDKLTFYDLSDYTTGSQRATAISALIQTFHSNYSVYPNYVLIDPVVNGVQIGYYS